MLFFLPENHSHFLFRSEKSEKLRERPGLQTRSGQFLRYTQGPSLYYNNFGPQYLGHGNPKHGTQMKPLTSLKL